MRRLLVLFTATATCMVIAPPSVASLAQRARGLSDTWGGSTAATDAFAFDSLYEKNGEQRGWANWLIKDRLILGQYPHCQPAEPGPSADDAQAHLRKTLAAGVTCFTSLQAELPPQDDLAAWPAEGVKLADPEAQRKWPLPFVRYAADADAIAASLDEPAKLSYLHCSIVDLAVPRKIETLLELLDEILAHYESGGNAIYIHCWGGRGRAGLVGACILSLLDPSLDADAVLRAVQAGYDTRTGAGNMPAALKKSPQTEQQRRFVKSFVSSVRSAARYENDVKMQAQGMPKGYL